ncbi:hypothetical protein T11_3630 [Trichinella zimbabwensis]|uniref:Uncharacterized protein n=1 Tax=Trichinella zimbabwensis TaxID=268475 RepID=A0A0V1GXG8_9BILA|nr:hypothetical protein T11_3630 [Trichinella zimbabwensis]
MYTRKLKYFALDSEKLKSVIHRRSSTFSVFATELAVSNAVSCPCDDFSSSTCGEFNIGC